jgi:UDP-N-acetylmuramoyl-tripeptide--D-alanyl-D-alanine ligase
MTYAELSRSIGARHVSSGNTAFSSVCIDSRSVKKGALFFAIEGNRDGHNYVKNAFEAGASGAVVSSSKLEQFKLLPIAADAGKELIIVNETLKGLHDSARVYLEKFPSLVKIGITGSNGKTTTKECAFSIISCEKKAVMNKGNLNSETGLPLSVFEVRECHEVGIFEQGTNRKGEIYETTSVLKPNIALITNIGAAHMEKFGNKTGILNEKKNIFSFLTKDDTALIPEDDECKEKLAHGVKGKVSYYGINTFSELEDIRPLGLDGSEIHWAGKTIHFSIPGRHSAYDAIAAIAIAKELNISNDAIKNGLENLKPLFGRQEILRGRCTVINDCYNANLESTRESIEFFESLDWKGRKVLCIGGMLELGNETDAAHFEIAQFLSRSSADMIFIFGKEMTVADLFLKSSGKKHIYTADMDELKKMMAHYVQDNDLVLLKASRFYALEQLCELLLGKTGAAPAPEGVS